MKFAIAPKVFLPGIFLSLAVASPFASAQTSFGLSTQSVTFTGLGGNALGEGQSLVTWGSCAYDGTNTTCTVSGPYIGLGGSGTFKFVLTYSGNGASPLTAISISPGNDLITFSLSSGSLITTLTEADGTTVPFYYSNFTFNFSSPTCVPAASVCAVGKIGLTPGSTITGPIVGNFNPLPIIRTAQGVISAGAFGAFPSLAPGSWMEIYGLNLANTFSQNWAASDFKGSQAPIALGGTTVTIGGQSAFIDYVSPGQVNAQVPSGVASGPQPVVVTTAGGSSAPYSIQVNSTQPGFLAPPQFVINGGQYVVALISGTLTYVLPVKVAGVATTRAKVGDSLTLYGVGFGPVTPNTPAGQIVSGTNALASLQVSFAGIPATVTYAGLAPGYVGLYQFNVTVPNVAASDTVPFTFKLNGVSGSQTMLIAVQ